MKEKTLNYCRKIRKAMTPEAFEQARRDFEKMWTPRKRGKGPSTFPQHLTALLGQHKEMLMEFVVWIGWMSSQIKYREIDDKWLWITFDETSDPFGFTTMNTTEYSTIELFEWWLKNVKR